MHDYPLAPGSGALPRRVGDIHDVGVKLGPGRSWFAVSAYRSNTGVVPESPQGLSGIHEHQIAENARERAIRQREYVPVFGHAETGMTRRD
jgi:hypothetical protein